MRDVENQNLLIKKALDSFDFDKIVKVNKFLSEDANFDSDKFRKKLVEKATWVLEDAFSNDSCVSQEAHGDTYLSSSYVLFNDHEFFAKFVSGKVTYQEQEGMSYDTLSLYYVLEETEHSLRNNI